MVKYFVQMSGVPGSGKSTIARALASKLPAVVLDHDDTKTAILDSGVSESQAGAASYEVIKTVSSRIVSQGFSVIVDSPCFYSQLLEHGLSTALGEGAEYRYVECILPDLSELDRRLRRRDAKPTQIQSLDQIFSHAGAEPRRAGDLILDWAGKVQRPNGSLLQLDTSVPVDACVAHALNYIVCNDR